MPSSSHNHRHCCHQLTGRYLTTPSTPSTRSTPRLKRAPAPRNHMINLFFFTPFLSRYCEGCMACLTAYIIYFCAETHYEKCLKKVSRFVHEQNEQVRWKNLVNVFHTSSQVWTKHGLLITDPVERGLRVVEISLLTEPAPGNPAPQLQQA